MQLNIHPEEITCKKEDFEKAVLFVSNNSGPADKNLPREIKKIVKGIEILLDEFEMELEKNPDPKGLTHCLLEKMKNSPHYQDAAKKIETILNPVEDTKFKNIPSENEHKERCISQIRIDMINRCLEQHQYKEVVGLAKMGHIGKETFCKIIQKLNRSYELDILAQHRFAEKADAIDLIDALGEHEESHYHLRLAMEVAENNQFDKKIIIKYLQYWTLNQFFEYLPEKDLTPTDYRNIFEQYFLKNTRIICDTHEVKNVLKIYEKGKLQLEDFKKILIASANNEVFIELVTFAHQHNFFTDTQFAHETIAMCLQKNYPHEAFSIAKKIKPDVAPQLIQTIQKSAIDIEDYSTFLKCEPITGQYLSPIEMNTYIKSFIASIKINIPSITDKNEFTPEEREKIFEAALETKKRPSPYPSRSLFCEEGNLLTGLGVVEVASNIIRFSSQIDYLFQFIKLVKLNENIYNRKVIDLCIDSYPQLVLLLSKEHHIKLDTNNYRKIFTACLTAHAYKEAEETATEGNLQLSQKELDILITGTKPYEFSFKETHGESIYLPDEK